MSAHCKHRTGRSANYLIGSVSFRKVTSKHGVQTSHAHDDQVHSALRGELENGSRRPAEPEFKAAALA